MTVKTAAEWSLASLIERGGVYAHVPGTNPRELIASVIDLLPPVSLDKEQLLREILEREALVSTGIGRGIALPHPRNPLGEKEDRAMEASLPLVAVAYPALPIDWNAPDGNKVHVVFLIVSSTIKQHLNTLSGINFLCQQDEFYSLIQAQSSQEAIVTAIREAETNWAGIS